MNQRKKNYILNAIIFFLKFVENVLFYILNLIERFGCKRTPFWYFTWEGSSTKIFLKQKKSVGIPSRNLDINVKKRQNWVWKWGSWTLGRFFVLRGLCHLAESDVASAINAEKREQVVFDCEEVKKECQKSSEA